jgi:N-acetyl-alpha-D-glucosaminyl L-malate synthase BshA
MNIAILCYHRIGGSGVVAYEIGRAMAEEKGHMVHFIGLEPPFRLIESESDRMKFHKVYVKEYPVFDFQPYSLALASQLSNIIKKCNINVIHSHYALPHAISALLARDISGKQVRCVTTLHGTDITVVGAHPSMAEVTSYAIEKSDAVTAVSKSLTIETEEKFSITPGRIKTIYNFVNPEVFNPNLRSAPDCPKQKIIVLHLSNLRAVKRPLDVIEIFKIIHEHKNWPLELQIVGEGPMQYEMMAMVERLNIEKHVKFVGVRNDIGTVIACSDLMLLPSQNESFGLAALEAMACGVPVVASRVGGLAEVIEDGRTGFLFKVGDTGEAAQKAINLLQDKKLYEYIRKEALADAETKFSMKKIVDQYEEIYRN